MENKYCNNCKFLSLTEEQQEEKRKVARANNTYLKNKINDFHYCQKYDNKRIMHNGQHPLLPRLKECFMDS